MLTMRAESAIITDTTTAVRLSRSRSVTRAERFCVRAQNHSMGYHSFANSLPSCSGMAPITPGFGTMPEGFFSCIDDAMTYILP